jgi:Ca-activated chloride channel family protein
LKELNAFNTVGERDQDGTSIGYAIYKAASLIAATRHYAEALAEKKEPAYTIKSEVIILLTDGLQDPNPLDKGKRLRNMDVPEAALYAKSQGIHLYIVNVEPQLNDEQFAPYRHIMQKAAASSGGRFYMVDEKGNLDKIYHDIDQLEKGLIREPLSRNKDQRPDLYRKISFYPYLTALAAACLLCYIFFETYFFRRVP